jgi:transglutaminase-like putative cysteine protease
MMGALPRRRYRVIHKTEYHYGATMTSGLTVAHLLLRETAMQHVISADIAIDPLPEERHTWIDAFGNLAVQITVASRHDHLNITAVSEAEVADALWPNSPLTVSELAALSRGLDGEMVTDVAPFVTVSPFVPATSIAVVGGDDVSAALAPDRPATLAIVDLCGRIFYGYRFDSGFSDISTPLDQVVRERRGVCQDFAHLAIAALRGAGLAARYVSGYLETIPPAGAAKLIGADASHAWCAVWLGPELGWWDFDPTNNQMPPRSHVTTAWGRDYGDVAPVRGVVLGPTADQHMTVSVDVARLS